MGQFGTSAKRAAEDLDQPALHDSAMAFPDFSRTLSSEIRGHAIVNTFTYAVRDAGCIPQAANRPSLDHKLTGWQSDLTDQLVAGLKNPLHCEYGVTHLPRNFFHVILPLCELFGSGLNAKHFGAITAKL